jgi:lysophospholipase L1-like esterase
MSHTRLIAVLAGLILSVGFPGLARAQTPALELRRGDTVVLIGNTLAERMQYFNHFETLLMLRFPELQLRVRNLGWSGDALALQPRPLNFGDASKHLQQQKADVMLAFFGASESFAGEAGLPQFEHDLETYLRTHAAATYNGKTPPRLALISPIAHEKLPQLGHVDVVARNRDLERYTAAMRAVAAREKVAFVDLFTPSLAAMHRAPAPLTDNGIHLNEAGDAVVAELLMQGLGFMPASAAVAAGAKLRQVEALRADIREKNQQFFYRWRPLNAEYVVGRRVEPFGSISFPPEMQQLDEVVTDLDNRIWKRAAAIGMARFPPPARPAATRAKPPAPETKPPGIKRDE